MAIEVIVGLPRRCVKPLPPAPGPGLLQAIALPGVLLLLILLLLAQGCSRNVAASNAAPPPPTVQVAEVVQKDVPVYHEWVATLDGFVNAQIQPQVTGYLIKQNYTEGSLVRKNQVLFKI